MSGTIDPVQQSPGRKARICGAYLAGERIDDHRCRLPYSHSPSNIHRDGLMFYWDDREVKTVWPSGVPEKCALCGECDPSHVAVRNGDDLVADRVCAKHTLYEVIRSGKFYVQVGVSND